MVVKTDGRLFAAAGFLCGLTQRMQAGFYGADGGQQSENPEYDKYPDSESKPVLNPDPKKHKKQHWEDNGKAKLTYPHQKIQNFHSASGKLCFVNHIFIP
jgi:hypothetical protein